MKQTNEKENLNSMKKEEAKAMAQKIAKEAKRLSRIVAQKDHLQEEETDLVEGMLNVIYSSAMLVFMTAPSLKEMIIKPIEIESTDEKKNGQTDSEHKCENGEEKDSESSNV